MGAQVPTPTADTTAAVTTPQETPSDMTITERAIGRIERVVWVRVPEAGLVAVVAIHAPRLGIALGGCTVLGGADSADAMVIAMHQAEAATLAARMAGVPAGGGAVVVPGEPGPRALAALGDVIERLAGALWLVPDLGADAGHGRVVARHTRFAADPGPHDGAAGIVSTAHGAWRQATDSTDLAGVSVRVLGEWLLADTVAEMLAGDGAVVARARDGRGPMEPVDMVVSCSPAALTDAQAVALRCRVVVGAPGDALESEAVWAALSARGVLAVPGTVAGGALISAAYALASPGRGANRLRVA